MRRKIVVVASYGGPYGGNFIASLVEFDQAMRSKGFDLSYVFPEFAKGRAWNARIEAVCDRVYYVRYQPYSVHNIRAFRRIIHAEKPDLIYSRLGGWDLTVRLAAPMTPVIWHLEYSLELDAPGHKRKYWVKYRLFAGRKTYHVAVSLPSASEVNSLHPHNVCTAIPNAIDLGRLKRKNPYEIQKPCRVLIFAYSPITKGLDLALDALEQLNAAGTNYYLLISAQEKTYPYLQQRYQTNPDWIKLLAPTDDISSVYQQADIMLSASRHEGFSYCLAEAIYSGLPVVFSDIAGTSWAGEFRMTYQFRTESKDDLVNALEQCASAVIDRNSQDYNAHLMREKYSVPAWGRQMAELVEEILGKTCKHSGS